MRKRGGIAGFWDRNKKIIKPIATIGAGILTGGAGGALVGGLMNGLDREGKGGIGFDVGKGAMGAAQGYGMGKIGGALKSGVMSRLGAQGAGAAMQGANPAAMTAVQSGGLPGLQSAAAPDFFARAGGMAASEAAGPGVASRALAGAGNFLKDGKNVMALGQTALGGVNAYQQNQQNQFERDQVMRRNRQEDEVLERQRGLDPARSALLQALFARLGITPTSGATS